MSKPFILNTHGQMVFPSNVFGHLDFSVIDTVDQLSSVVKRDFESKSPTGTDIADRASSGAYRNRGAMMRDMALHMFWANRYAMTMYDKRPTRWRDVPRQRDDVYLPLLTPWEDGEAKIEAIDAGYAALPPQWDGETEDRIFALLRSVFLHKLNHATELQPIKPTVAEILKDPTNLTFCVEGHDPDYPIHSFQEIIDCQEDVPELEALHRMAMVLHNQYPWDHTTARLEQVGNLKDDDFVVVFAPRTREVQQFIERAKTHRPGRRRPAPPTPPQPGVPVPPVIVADTYTVRPKIEALAVEKGEYVCTNDDVIRNSAYCWSPMSAHDISSKTGIEARLYSARDLEILGLCAAQTALEKAGREPSEIAAVIFCSCTNTRLIPSVACWLSGQLGIYQTHASYDLVAACAGFPYGLAAAMRIMDDINRPVLVVFAEKFSDKIGNVRTSRMIFGDGAAAMVLAPAADGEPSDLEVLQSYASGPQSQVNSIIWPNPEFDNDITVWGPEVKALVTRYLTQMMDELGTLPDGYGDVDLIVPHQANRTMVVDLGTAAGVPEDKMYFNIDRVGNASAASIPIAIHDAVVDGVIDRPMRVFAPGFGAGSIAGYAVLRVDPAVVVEGDTRGGEDGVSVDTPSRAFSWEDEVATL